MRPKDKRQRSARKHSCKATTQNYTSSEIQKNIKKDCLRKTALEQEATIAEDRPIKALIVRPKDKRQRSARKHSCKATTQNYTSSEIQKNIKKDCLRKTALEQEATIAEDRPIKALLVRPKDKRQRSA